MPCTILMGDYEILTNEDRTEWQLNDRLNPSYPLPFRYLRQLLTAIQEDIEDADLDHAGRLTALRQELEAIAYRNVCAMCSSPLSVSWNGRKDTYQIDCSQNQEHTGWECLQSLYETWRRGGTLPVEVAEALESKYGEGGQSGKPNGGR